MRYETGPRSREHTFWRRVRKTDDCWEWIGTRNTHGYGIVQRIIDGRHLKFMAHRISYEWLVGPIPSGLVVDHLCRNTSCVRPDHLEPVTDQVNILRGTGPSAIAAKRTHCIRGHRFPGKRSGRGERICPECVRLKNRANYVKQRAVLGRGPHNRDKTHCVNGHEFTPENTYVKADGRRNCRMCERLRRRKAT